MAVKRKHLAVGKGVLWLVVSRIENDSMYSFRSGLFATLSSMIHLAVVAVGENNGMLFGRRYFQCREKHGIFVRAEKIRFIPSVRW